MWWAGDSKRRNELDLADLRGLSKVKMSDSTALGNYEEIARIAIEGNFPHNLGVLKSIVGGIEIALSDPIDFDPRAEYWFLPERRFLIAYLARHFPQWPQGDAERELAEFAVMLSSELDGLRSSGAISFTKVDYERGAETLVQPIRNWIEGLAPFEHWQDLKVRREHSPSARQSLSLFCNAIAGDGFKPYDPGVGRRWS